MKLLENEGDVIVRWSCGDDMGAEFWNSWSLGGISEGDHSGGSGRSHCKK